MNDTSDFSSRERLALGATAALGGLGLNGAFVYGVLARPGSLAAALANPIALAFAGEALVLLVLLAYLLPRLGVPARRRPAFVALSLLGGIAFALPLLLLLRRDSR